MRRSRLPGVETGGVIKHRITLSDDWFDTIDSIAREYGKPRTRVLADLLELSSLDSLREMYDEDGDDEGIAI